MDALDRAIPPGNPEATVCRWCRRAKESVACGSTFFVLCSVCDSPGGIAAKMPGG